MNHLFFPLKKKTWTTKEVSVGGLLIGGTHPIRIQSMTNCPTSDIQMTVEQICKLADHGCEMVRLAVQGIKEAAACETIKNQLLQRGYQIPLIADIHFLPNATALSERCALEPTTALYSIAS